MIRQLHHAITKEFLTFFRDPATRFMLLAAPLLQLLIFSFAATLEVSNVNIGVINRDTGQWSQELIQRVGAASFASRLVWFEDVESLSRAIDGREVLLGMHFQPDFSREIDAGNTGVVQVLIDGRRANSGQISLSYMSTIAVEMGVELATLNPRAPPTPTVNVRHWFNPNLEYRWFMVPALVAMLSLTTPLMMSSLSIARERELGTFDQLLVAPITSTQIIVGKAMPGLFSGVFSGCLITALAVYGFGIPFRGSLPLLLMSMPVFVIAVIGYGLTISAVCNTQQQAMMGIFFSMLPFVLTSGFMTPVENMPDWLERIAQLNPLKHFILIVQGSFLKSLTFAELLQHLGPLLIIALCTLTSATVILKGRLR